MFRKINVFLGMFIIILIVLIVIRYYKNGKTTFILYQSIHKMQEASSYEVASQIDISGELGLLAKKNINSTFLIDTKYVKEPELKIKQSYYIKILSLKPKLTEQYIIEEDGKYQIYTENPIALKSTWHKRVITKQKNLPLNDLELLTSLILLNKELDIKRISNDEVDQISVSEIEILLNDEDSKWIVKKVIEKVSGEPVSVELNKAIDEALDHTCLRLHLYINQETKHFHKIELDLTPVFKRLLESEIDFNHLLFDLLQGSMSHYTNINSVKFESRFKGVNETDFILPDLSE